MASIWRKWLRNPLQVGSIRPSSEGLIRLMMAQIPPDAKVIVEYGAGTGPITEALVQTFPQAKIYAFELEPDLAKKVREKLQGFTNLTVFNSNVVDSPQLIPTEYVGHVDVVVSSLPLINIGEDVNLKIFKSAAQILKPQAPFVQFTYLPFMPPSKAPFELGFWARFVGAETRNVPPAFVWIFKKLS